MCSVIYNYPKIQELTRKYNEKLQIAMSLRYVLILYKSTHLILKC